jgi:hypothetical protein
VSAHANDVIITAEQNGTQLASLQFSVVSVPISINTTPGAASPGDSAWAAFSAGVSTLGSTITNFPGSSQVCAVAVELIGAVVPSDYTGQVTLRRSKNTYAYKGTQLFAGFPEVGDDTSEVPLLDTTPQTSAPGATQGNVYDLDAPGVSAPLGVSDGPGSPDWFNHYRSNFVEYAILGDYTTATKEKDSSSSKNASSSTGNFQWFAAASCTFDPNTGDTIISTQLNPAGDNKAGQGTTATTYNLQQ